MATIVYLPSSICIGRDADYTLRAIIAEPIRAVQPALTIARRGDLATWAVAPGGIQIGAASRQTQRWLYFIYSHMTKLLP